MPHLETATTPAAREAATTASTAFPPWANIVIPASAPSGWPTTRPCRLDERSAPIVRSAAAAASVPPAIAKNERRLYSDLFIVIAHLRQFRVILAGTPLNDLKWKASRAPAVPKLSS